MKKILFMTALAAVAFTSCSQDEFETPSGNIVGSNAIVFATSQKAKAMTRAGGETATTIDKFTVDAVNADNSKFFTSEVFSFDQTKSVFSSSVSHYWPTTGTLSFYAINPAGTHALDANNVPYYTYSNWAGEKDLLAATVRAGEKQIPYPLAFKHLTSQIYVSAESQDKTQELTYKLVSVKLKTPSTGTYNFADATGGVGTWTIDNTKTSEYSYATALPRSFKQNGQVELSSCYWNILPVTNGTMTFSIEYQVLQNGKIITDNTGVNAKTCTVESPNLEAGKRYNYNFQLAVDTQDEILFSVTIANWENSTSTNREPDKVIDATSITLNKTSLFLVIGDTFTLKVASVEPSDASTEVEWTSSNPSVASVDKTTGLVTAIGFGYATITATTPKGVTATCLIDCDYYGS